MGTGWRRAFCTSVRRDGETASPVLELQPGSDPSPRHGKCAKLSFFGGGGGGGGNTSTPRLPKQKPTEPSTSKPATPRCRTKTPAAAADAAGPADVVRDSPKLQCKTTPSVAAPKSEPATPGSRGRSPRFPFFSSNPSSPRPPSPFSLLRNNLRLTRSGCGICLQSVKAKQGTAIFTAECSHVFHFHCIAADVRKRGSLVCPVCQSAWRQVPLLADLPANTQNRCPSPPSAAEETEQESQKLKLLAAGGGYQPSNKMRKGASEAGGARRLYDDDEPLHHFPAGVARRFNPIPEADEDLQDDDDHKGEGGEEFRGFFSVDPSPVTSPRTTTPRRRKFAGGGGHVPGVDGVQVTVHPTVALLSSGRAHENYVIAVRVKAPASELPPFSPVPRSASCSAAAAALAPPILEPSRRAPIDLVTVLDVGGHMTSAKLHMMKRAMRLVVASLGPADRLSMVAAFSTAAKRILPLRRMSPEGQRAARRIVDRLVRSEGSRAGEALRKAVKVLEDRRERNPVASIMLLSDGHREQQQTTDVDDRREPYPHAGGAGRRALTDAVPFSPGTRFAHLEIPFLAPGTAGAAAEHPGGEEADDAFARCVGSLLSVVLQDVCVDISFPAGEVRSVYASGGRPISLGGGAGRLRLGDMCAGEEWELLVEVRVPSARRAVAEQDPGLHHLSVRCTYKDPFTQELVPGKEQRLLVAVTRHYAPAAAPKVDRLRNLFVTNRSVAEARRLADHGDIATGLHLLCSARRLLQQSGSVYAKENLRAVETELERLHHLRRQTRWFETPETPVFPPYDGAGADALTPTSAWRAAERLAKVAIMRKSMNRVSDLHGFEDARF